MLECDIKKVAELIRSATKIVITGHVKPDPDALGSILALGLSLRKLNKEVIMTVDDELPKSLAFMPHIDEIEGLDKISPQSADLLILLDSSDLERAGRVPEVISAPLLNIDHHISNKGFSEYRYLDAAAAATGEIMYSLICELGVELDAAIAKNLYTAIATDCGFFQYSNTTKHTMQCAAELLDYGVKPDEIQYALDCKSRKSVELLAHMLTNMEFFQDGQIALLSLEHDKYDPDIDTEGFINYARYVQGVEVAVFLKEVDTSTTRVSMRSKDVNVSVVALHFGGGGHFRASGCTIHKNLDEARVLLLKELQQAVMEHNNG